MITLIILLSIWSADSEAIVYLLYLLYLLEQSIPRIKSVTTTPSLTDYKSCESSSNLTSLSRLEVLCGNLSQVLVASDILDQPGDCCTPYLGGLAGLARRALLHHLWLSYDSHLGGALPSCHCVPPHRSQAFCHWLVLY